jgi:hypothetical protein
MSVTVGLSRLREEHRVRVFEKRAVSEVFGTKREEVTGGWRRLHNEELHNLYASPNTIQMMKSRWSGQAEHVTYMEQMQNACKILVGKPKGKISFGKLRRKVKVKLSLCFN